MRGAPHFSVSTFSTSPAPMSSDRRTEVRTFVSPLSVENEPAERSGWPSSFTSLSVIPGTAFSASAFVMPRVSFASGGGSSTDLPGNRSVMGFFSTTFSSTFAAVLASSPLSHAVASAREKSPERERETAAAFSLVMVVVRPTDASARPHESPILRTMEMTILMPRSGPGRPTGARACDRDSRALPSIGPNGRDCRIGALERPRGRFGARHGACRSPLADAVGPDRHV